MNWVVFLLRSDKLMEKIDVSVKKVELIYYGKGIFN